MNTCECECEEQIQLRARATDPETSHAAAAKVNTSYVKRRILELLEEHPEGLTTLELADLSGIPRVTVSPMPSPMEEEGLVKYTGTKRKGHTGCDGKIWKLAPPGTPPKVRAPKKAVAHTERFFLGRDEDFHWYIVPEVKRALWAQYVSCPVGELPEGVIEIDSPSKVTFTNPQVS